MSSYLNKNILNDIENKVANLHNLFKEKFNIAETSLRNIKINDNLDNRILYMNFPWESHEKIKLNAWIDFIITSNNNNLRYRLNDAGTRKTICYFYKMDNTNMILYSKFNSNLNNDFNYIRYRLPSDMGIVTSIDSTDIFYPYIKIKDDKYKLLEYNKKTWIDNEIPYLQYIDNIEEGINNVAEILFKPAEYEYKPWTTTGYYGIENNDYGLAQRPISQRDFDRWNKNIELLESIMGSFFNIWNVVSYIEWNKKSDYEWEES